MTPDPANWRLKPTSDIEVDVVIPVHNEAHVLESSVQRVHEFFGANVPHRWKIVIAENGSRDRTEGVARQLCRQASNVDLLVVGQPGRGRALRTAWMHSTADLVCYTDVDLSTELEAFPRLFRALVDHEYDLAVGSRLLKDSRTTRGMKREIISRGYNLFLKLALGVRVSDAQAGFKALTRDAVRRIIPLAKDQSWFLDTEILVLAEKLGMRIADIPITWVDDDDSRVKIIDTARKDIQGVLRLRRAFRAGTDWMTAGGDVERGER